jgi:hypothetical protein
MLASEDEGLRASILYSQGDDRCTCDYAWRSCLGRLYGISMGAGWVRLTTTPGCPHHSPD